MSTRESGGRLLLRSTGCTGTWIKDLPLLLSPLLRLKTHTHTHTHTPELLKWLSSRTLSSKTKTALGEEVLASEDEDEEDEEEVLVVVVE